MNAWRGDGGRDARGWVSLGDFARHVALEVPRPAALRNQEQHPEVFPPLSELGARGAFPLAKTR